MHENTQFALPEQMEILNTDDCIHN